MAPQTPIGSTDFIALVRGVEGVPADHPALFSGSLARRVKDLLVSGAIPSVRLNGRFLVDPAQAPRAAELLGLVTARRAA